MRDAVLSLCPTTLYPTTRAIASASFRLRLITDRRSRNVLPLQQLRRASLDDLFGFTFDHLNPDSDFILLNDARFE